MDLYLIFYNKLTERADNNNKISRQVIEWELGRIFHIPKKMKKHVIKEMEKKKMLRRVNRDTYELI
jgi:NurA-like 5'-3' nuclease